MYIKLLEWIHPLSDGNGRSVRLFLTILLRHYGIPIILDSNIKNNNFNDFMSILSRKIN